MRSGASASGNATDRDRWRTDRTCTRACGLHRCGGCICSTIRGAAGCTDAGGARVARCGTVGDKFGQRDRLVGECIARICIVGDIFDQRLLERVRGRVGVPVGQPTLRESVIADDDRECHICEWFGESGAHCPCGFVGRSAGGGSASSDAPGSADLRDRPGYGVGRSCGVGAGSRSRPAGSPTIGPVIVDHRAATGDAAAGRGRRWRFRPVVLIRGRVLVGRTYDLPGRSWRHHGRFG